MMLKTLRIFLLTAGLTVLSWFYLAQDAYKYADWIFSKFPIHRLQLVTTFEIWIPVLVALFFVVFIESLIQAIQTRKYSWELYWIFVYLGVLIGLGHFVLFFMVKPEYDHGAFESPDQWELYSLFYLIAIALSVLGYCFKKKPAPRYQFFIITNVAVISGTLLLILFSG